MQRRKESNHRVQLVPPPPDIRTQIFDGVVALLVVHFDGLGMRAADAIADGIPSDHDVLVLRRGPAHHDTRDERADVERTRYFRNTGFWGEKWKSKMRSTFV